MQREPDEVAGSPKSTEAHRRDRAVHKIRLSELANLSQEEISSMVASGDIELLVRRSDIADGSGGGWSQRLAGLFDMVSGGLGGAPDHENRTIIVNIVAGGRGTTTH